MFRSSFVFVLLVGLVFPSHARADTIVNLSSLGDGGTTPTAINNAGQVVGNSTTLAGVYPHAFLYSEGMMQDLGTLGGDSCSWAYSINDSAQVTGFSANSVAGGGGHVFAYSGGMMQDLGTFGGAAAIGYGINDAGQIVGWFSVGNGNSHGFLYSNGTMQDLGSGCASAINSAGQIVGQHNISEGPNGIGHAYIYCGGVMQDIGELLNSNDSYAVAINNIGQVVGTYSVGSGLDAEYPAFLYCNGTMQDLGLLSPLGMNNLGQVVGNIYISDGPNSIEHAILYSNGVMTDLNDLLPPGSGWTLNEATAINDSGQIVGYGTFNGQEAGFLMTTTPTPEPSTFALLIASCLGGLLCFRRKL
jgi:probable HAF family extracellular repeat protein